MHIRVLSPAETEDLLHVIPIILNVPLLPKITAETKRCIGNATIGFSERTAIRVALFVSGQQLIWLYSVRH